MKSIKNILFFSIGSFFSFSVHAEKDVVTNCEKNEEIIFSCNAGKKIISICSSSKNSEKKYLNYRFGLPGKIELNVRSIDEGRGTQFYRSEILGASNAATAIWFKKSKYYYVLTSPIKGDTTIEVIKNNKSISRLACTSDFSGDIDTPNDLFQNSGQSEYFKLYGVE